MPRQNNQSCGLSHETKLGIDTRLGSSGGGHHLTVNLELDRNGEINAGTIKAIIEVQKPAHTAYILQIRQRNAETAG